VAETVASLLNDPSLLLNQCLIDGQWRHAATGAVIAVTNPATSSQIATVPNMGTTETEAAIDAAQAALPGWRAILARDRARIIRTWAELMMAHQDDLATIMTLEQGKVLTEAKGEIAYAASFFEWFAEEAVRVYGDIIPTHDTGKRILTIKQPVGVVGAITPWNFPAAMITRKAGPALASGCTMVLKPASATPLSALAIGELGLRAGLPPGVFNVVTGSARQIGGALTASPKVAKISFTGSTEVGRQLLRECADTVKKVSMELGGNAPFIVFDDADLDAAVAGAMASKYRNSGQTCVCTNRIYAQAGIHDAFVEKLVAAVSSLKVGPGMEAGSEQGPLIDMGAVEKVEAHIADALAKGATIATGGARHRLGGSYFQPTVITGATHAMEVARDETFGPLAPVFKFDTEDEAITMANDTEFGLAAYFFSGDVGRVFRVGEALEAGIVGVNTGLISTAVAPFGGVKQSGLGREGSKYGIEDYLEIKYLCLGITS
jgi:succinate-semialdehyde dehydrogenase / glutarate-semialdehyde dehydrogenase